MFIIPTRIFKQEIRNYVVLNVLLVVSLTYIISGTTTVPPGWVFAFVFCVTQSMGLLLFITYICSRVVTKDMELTIYLEGKFIKTTGEELVETIDEYIKQGNDRKSYTIFGKSVTLLRNKEEYNFALYYRHMKILNKFNNVKDYTDMLNYIMYKNKRKNMITSNIILYSVYYPDLKRKKKW